MTTISITVEELLYKIQRKEAELSALRNVLFAFQSGLLETIEFTDKDALVDSNSSSTTSKSFSANAHQRVEIVIRYIGRFASKKQIVETAKQVFDTEFKSLSATLSTAKGRADVSIVSLPAKGRQSRITWGLSELRMEDLTPKAGFEPRW